MITKFKLILSFTAAFLMLSFFIWVYSLTERLEAEKDKRLAAEGQIALVKDELKQAQNISEAQSELAKQQSQQTAFLEATLKEINNAQESQCSVSPATHAVLNRLWQ